MDLIFAVILLVALAGASYFAIILGERAATRWQPPADRPAVRISEEDWS